MTSFCELKLSLFNRLVKVRDEKNFVNLIMSIVEHPDDVEAMIDFTDEEPDEATLSNITNFAVDMSQEMDGGDCVDDNT